MFSPWINDPNSLLIRLADYFYNHKMPLKNLKAALGEPPKNIWNSLEASIFSSYGTQLRQQLCHYALQEGIGLGQLSQMKRYSPLHSPIFNERHHLDTLKFVLTKAGENCNVLGECKRDAFITASIYGYPQVLAYLYSRGENLLNSDEQGLSAISYSAASGRHEVVDFFIDLPLEGLILERKLELIFHSALLHGNIKIIQYLENRFKSSISLPELMTTKSENGKTAYENLVQGYSAPLYLYLERYINLKSYRDDQGNSLLHFALKSTPFNTLYRKNDKDKYSFIRFLLQCGFECFECNQEGQHPFHIFTASQIWKEQGDLYTEYLQDIIASLKNEERTLLLSEVASPKSGLAYDKKRNLASAIIHNWHSKDCKKLDLDAISPSGRPLLSQLIQNEYVYWIENLGRLGLMVDTQNKLEIVSTIFERLNAVRQKFSFSGTSPRKLMKLIYAPRIYIDKLLSVASQKEYISVFTRTLKASTSLFFREALKNNCNLELKDRSGLTALCVASGLGMTAYVKHLLKSNANPLGTDNNNNNALFYAVYSNSPEIIDLLIEDVLHKNPSEYPRLINQKSTDGSTPLIEAGRLKRLYCLYKLLNSEKQYLALINPCSSKNELGQSSLKESIQNNDEEENRLPSIIEINAQDHKNETILSFSGSLKLEWCQQIQKYLLERGAKVTDRAMVRALDFRSLKEKYDLLLKYGGNINAKNTFGESLLMQTILHYLKNPSSLLEDALTYLLESGADINSQNNKGETIIMKIISYPVMSIPAAFLKADLTLRNKKGQPFFEIAEEWLLSQVCPSIKWLKSFILAAAREQGNDVMLTKYDVPLAWKILKGKDKIELIQKLLIQGADVNQRFGILKITPLVVAFQKNMLEITQFLIHQGGITKFKRLGKNKNTLKTFWKAASCFLTDHKDILPLLNRNALKYNLSKQDSYWELYNDFLNDKQDLKEDEMVETLIKWDETQPKGIINLLKKTSTEFKDFSSYLSSLVLINHPELLPESFNSLSQTKKDVFFMLFDKIKSKYSNRSPK